MAGLTLLELAYLAAVVGVGSFIRGYTGFGSSMIYVVGLTFAMPASEAVPVVLMLEIAATVRLLPAVWNQVDWR
ncbi:MAG TPA: sulfite exporter TauE/SafE family protein, partial [Alphaproteobacteria bacterium]|nr:sulfite exporter TauE/SafE family protein [Alphaproteobacteria bacterium]